MHPPPVVRIRLPPAPEPSARTGFPWAATLAPVLVSVVLWGVTGSVFGLLFAVLGPVVAVAGLLDGARSRRRSGRRDLERFRASCAAVLGEIAGAHAREHARLRAECPLPGVPRWHEGGAALPVLLGTGVCASVIELAADGAEPESPVVAEQYELLRRAAAEPPAGPVVRDAGAGVGVVGPPVLASSVARAVVLQLAASLSPATAELTAPAGEEWVSRLPHERRESAGDHYRWHLPDGLEIAVGWAAGEQELPVGCGATLRLDEVEVPHALGREPAERAAADLAERAAALGARPPRLLLPDRVELAGVLTATAGPGLSAPIGRDDSGTLAVDLVAQGPHALVAGTTGSGKSELLVSWVLAMAHGRSPAEVAFLLIDFKGGAAFAPLAGLPHVVGTLSDLDARLTRRAVLSLRAELLRRERVLAAAGARAIDDLPPGALARLVIVVDEYAALVAAGQGPAGPAQTAGGPELHDAFADLAARGRSLGLHLVLCTQRPAGVVRDAVLANIGLRISLRVTDRADAVAMLGEDSAARLPAGARGRAIVMHDGSTRVFQVALAERSDAVRIVAACDGVPAGAPWCDPLPQRIDLDELPAGEGGWAFGLVDLPGEQRQPAAVYDGAVHGALLVVGAAGSGVSTALATLAESARRAGCPVTVLPRDPADAWQVLDDMPARGDRPALLVIDDLDVVLDRFDAEHRHEFSAMLATMLRAGSHRVAAGVRRLDAEASRLAGLFGSRLVLRQASREDQLLAGGASALHDAAHPDPAQPPGAGTWQGDAVQVAIAAGAALPAAETPALARVTCRRHPRLALVTSRPGADAALLGDAGWKVIPLGSPAMAQPDIGEPEGSPTAFVGDADDWNAQWALLAALRREGSVVLHGCTVADHRALLPGRGLPPPLGADPAECWLVTADGTIRALFAQESVANRSSDH